MPCILLLILIYIKCEYVSIDDQPVIIIIIILHVILHSPCLYVSIQLLTFLSIYHITIGLLPYHTFITYGFSLSSPLCIVPA